MPRVSSDSDSSDSAQIMIVSVTASSACRPVRSISATFEVVVDGPDHSRSPCLASQNIFQSAVELIRPQMSVARRIDQLTMNANPPLRLAHTPFQDVPDPSSRPIVLISTVRALYAKLEFLAITNRCRKRDNAVVIVSDDAVREILLLRIAAQIRKWQDGHGSGGPEAALQLFSLIFDASGRGILLFANGSQIEIPCAKKCE